MIVNKSHAFFSVFVFSVFVFSVFFFSISPSVPVLEDTRSCGIKVSRIFISLSVSLCNYRGGPLFNGVGLAGQCLFIGQTARFLFVSYCFPFLYFQSMGQCCGAGVFGLIWCQSLSPSLALPIFVTNNNNH